MERNKSCGLAINNEVVAQIAGMAALEVDGVAGMGSKPMDIKGVKEVISSGKYLKSIGLTVDNGAILLDVYIVVKPNTRIKTVAERVQQNVKEKVQNMTGNAVARVNVIICDIEEPEEETAED